MFENVVRMLLYMCMILLNGRGRGKRGFVSHPVLRTNRMHNYMYVRIKFHTYRDIISE